VIGDGDGCDTKLCFGCLEQGEAAHFEGSAGGQDIIYQQQVFSLEQV